MHIPTVRVQNAAGDGFVTINVSDLRPEHALWSTQPQDFDLESVERARKPRLDPALRDFMAEMMLQFAGAEFERKEGRPFDTISDSEKLDFLRKLKAEADEHVAKVKRDMELWDQDDARANQVDNRTIQRPQPDNPGQSEVNRSSEDPANPSNTLKSLTIEPIRGSFYVMDGGKRVSKGLKTKAEAEEELKKLQG